MITLIVEGNDGAGKSSVAEELRTQFERIGRKAEVLHFPTQWFYSARDTAGPLTRYELVHLYLEDMLKEVRTWGGKYGHTNTVMILDRFWPSTHVYNLYVSRGLTLMERKKLLSDIQQLRDLVGSVSDQTRAYLLDVPYDLCRARVMARGGDMDEYDLDEAAAYKQRSKAYSHVLTAESSLTTITPGPDDSPGDIARKIVKDLDITNKGVRIS